MFLLRGIKMTSKLEMKSRPTLSVARLTDMENLSKQRKAPHRRVDSMKHTLMHSEHLHK
jgi:hypothetical protein